MKGLVGSPILVGGLGPGPPLNPALLYTQAHTLTKWSTQLLTPRLYHDSDKATKHVQLTGIWGRFLEYLFFLNLILIYNSGKFHLQKTTRWTI